MANEADEEGDQALALKERPVRADVAPVRKRDRIETPRPEREPDEGGGDRGGGDAKPRSRWPLIALIAAVVAAAIAGTIWWWLTRDLVSTDDAYTDGRAVLVAPRVAGPVTRLAVDDNQFVHAGDLLVEIDPRDFQAARDQAAGQLAAAVARLADAAAALDKARVSYPAQLAQAQGQLAQARGQLFLAQAEYRRQHGIDRAATSQQNVDQSTAGLQQAQGQVAQAEAQVRTAALVDQNVAQAEAQVAQLRGEVDQARAQLAQAEFNLGYTRVVAPQDGWVTKRTIETGDYVQPGQSILALVTPQLWITANFKETQLARMRPGQAVDIAVDAYPDLKLKGHVESVQLGSGSKFSAFPPENATGNFVKIVQRVPVKIVVDQGLDPARPLPLGISVEPTVTLK